MRQTRAIRPWTTGELRTLRETAHLGAGAVALLLGRSESSVRCMALRQRLSLRTVGERRGLVLGQPRGQSIAAGLRDDVVSGRVDDEVIARRMALRQESETCPACGRREIEVRSTGFCLPCHRRRLIEAHLDELERLDSQRSLWSSRQALCRARKAAEA